jgi:hypothetical protein
MGEIYDALQATPQPAPAVDSGQVGSYVTCDKCDGTGKLFVPQNPPVTLPAIDSAGNSAPAPEASDLRAAVAPFAAAADACDGYDPSMVVRMYLNTSPGSRLVGEFLLSDLRKLAAALKAGE